MAKTKISEWSTTPASNTDIDGINIAEGCAPSGINDAIRDLMAQVRSWQSGASGDPFNGPMNGTIGATTAYSGAFTTLSASGTTTLSGLTASTALALDASKNVVSVANTGSGSNVLATSPTLVTPALGTPSSATLTNATGLPISTGVSGLGTGVATALAVNVGSAGAPVVNGGALGTPSSGTVTNLTGTASININGTVGATTPTTGAFTTLTTSSSVTLSGGTANGVTYLNGSKVLTSGSALTFDGTLFAAPRVMASTSGYTVNSANTQLGIYNGTGYVQAPVGGTLQIWDSATNPIMSMTNSAIISYISNSEQMRLTSTGLGIGTSSPAVKLDVNGSINLANGNNLSWGGTFAAGKPSIYADATSNYLAFAPTGTTGGERMRLDSTGNLGLGVTPSASWTSNAKAIQIGARMAVYNDGSNNALFANNMYFDGSYNRYIATAASARYYLATDGSHIWNQAASGNAGDTISFTQAMTLDASGRLGIGETSPTTTLDAKAAQGRIKLTSSTGTNNALVLFNNTGGNAYVGLDSSGGGLTAAYALNLYHEGAYPITFSTNNTEAARIDSSGNLLVGCTATPSASVKGAGLIKDLTGTDLYLSSSDTSTDRVIWFYNPNGLVGGVTVSGSTTAYNTSSDQRLKQNIADADSASSLIDSLQVRKFDWKSDGTHQRYGFVAQELVTVAPEAVHQPIDTEEMMAVDYSKLVPMLVKEIQSLRQRVAQLETN